MKTRLSSGERLFEALCFAFVTGATMLACSSVESTPTVATDSNEWSEYPSTIVSAKVVGDSLETVVQYGGGCGLHEFELNANGSLLKSLPPKQPIRLVHRSSGDPCRALLTDTIMTALTPFRGTPHGTTVLILDGWEGNLLYTYH